MSKVPGVTGRNAIQKPAAGVCNAAKDDALIFVQGSAAQKAALLKFLHRVGGAGAGQQDPMAELAERSWTGMIKNIQYRELGHREAQLQGTRAHIIVNVFERAADSQYQLQRGNLIGVSGGAARFDGTLGAFHLSRIEHGTPGEWHPPFIRQIANVW